MMLEPALEREVYPTQNTNKIPVMNSPNSPDTNLDMMSINDIVCLLTLQVDEQDQSLNILTICSCRKKNYNRR